MADRSGGLDINNIEKIVKNGASEITDCHMGQPLLHIDGLTAYS